MSRGIWLEAQSSAKAPAKELLEGDPQASNGFVAVLACMPTDLRLAVLTLMHPSLHSTRAGHCSRHGNVYSSRHAAEQPSFLSSVVPAFAAQAPGDLTIMPGDTVTTTCDFNSSDRQVRVHLNGNACGQQPHFYLFKHPRILKLRPLAVLAVHNLAKPSAPTLHRSLAAVPLRCVVLNC